MRNKRPIRSHSTLGNAAYLLRRPPRGDIGGLPASKDLRYLVVLVSSLFHKASLAEEQALAMFTAKRAPLRGGRCSNPLIRGLRPPDLSH
jgi:hypothetical protein